MFEGWYKLCFCLITCHQQNVVFIYSVQMPKRWKVIHRCKSVGIKKKDLLWVEKTRIFPSLQNNWQKNMKWVIVYCWGSKLSWELRVSICP